MSTGIEAAKQRAGAAVDARGGRAEAHLPRDPQPPGAGVPRAARDEPAGAVRPGGGLRGGDGRLRHGDGVPGRVGPRARDHCHLRGIRRAAGDRARVRAQPDRHVGRGSCGGAGGGDRAGGRARSDPGHAGGGDARRQGDHDQQGRVRGHRRGDDGAPDGGGLRRPAHAGRGARRYRVPRQGRARVGGARAGDQRARCDGDGVPGGRAAPAAHPPRCAAARHHHVWRGGGEHRAGPDGGHVLRARGAAASTWRS